MKRADLLIDHLDAWRVGRSSNPSLDLSPKFGTVDWWIEKYFRSEAFVKLAERTKASYRSQLRLLANLPTRSGGRLGDLPSKSITAAAVDKIYRELRGGQFGKKFRTANLTTDIAKNAWKVVQRTHPDQFVLSNPFIGLTRTLSSCTPDAARGYVKRTETQRIAAARKRQVWAVELEHAENESQNKTRKRESE